MDELKDMKLDDSLTDLAEEDAQAAESSGAAADDKDEAVREDAAESEETSEKQIDPEEKPEKQIDPQDIPVKMRPDQVSDALADRKPSLDTALERATIEPVGLPMDQRRGVHDRELSLMLKTRGRALSEALMTIAGTRQRSGRLWMTCAATFILIVLFIVQVFYRHRELNLGYDLSAAISQREALLEENRKLRIELRVLSRRERLEPLAGKQLGMSSIKPEQVLILDMSKTGRTDQRQGKRADGLDKVKRIEKE
ncbi:MAG: cell division protein FtsL [Proteobacteria bacterium]|nr:cell division protein FtsL [Pseudomonadota bacterium]